MARLKVVPPNFGEPKRILFPEVLKHRIVSCGSFAKIKERTKEGELVIDGWTYCREYFHEGSHGIRQFLFVCKRGKARNIAAFMHEVEQRLKLRKTTKFGPTQRHNVIWVEVSPWWTSTSMKRSLFTAFLRTGSSYALTKDNFEEALYSTRYTAETRLAINRFLSGHTKYTGRVRGWFNQFQYGGSYPPFDQKPKLSEIRKLLVKPA